eukprot:scaffold83762_cov25-Prasinocladus_malaysianus.AAC.1
MKICNGILQSIQLITTIPLLVSVRQFVSSFDPVHARRIYYGIAYEIEPNTKQEASHHSAFMHPYDFTALGPTCRTARLAMSGESATTTPTGWPTWLTTPSANTSSSWTTGPHWFCGTSSALKKPWTPSTSKACRSSLSVESKTTSASLYASLRSVGKCIRGIEKQQLDTAVPKYKSS